MCRIAIFIACCVFLSGNGCEPSARAADPEVKLVRQYSMEGLPPPREGFSYQAVECAALPEGTFQCVRPVPSNGELITWTPSSGISRLSIPQPDGFQPRYDFKSYFEYPALFLNQRGDRLIRWQLEGNGDHGLALLRNGSSAWTTARIDFPLVDSRLVSTPEGAWYLVQWSASVYQGFKLSVFRLDEKLRPQRIASQTGPGHHSIRTVDARFSSERILHLIWAEVNPRTEKPNHLRILATDLDVRERSWAAERELFRLDQFTSSAHPTALVLGDGRCHYFWDVDEGEKRTTVSGTYYRAPDSKAAVKVADSYHGAKVWSAERDIVVCFTQSGHANKVFFRVLRDGKAYPASAIDIENRTDYPLWDENMLLGGDGITIRFVNTLDIKRVYEIQVKD